MSDTVIEALFLSGVRLWVQEGTLRYRAPKGALTEPQRAQLAAHKEAILKMVREGEIFPLSFPQQRLWFFSQLLPESPVYNNPEVVRIRGPLVASALSHSLDEVLRRHDALRATFVNLSGQPAQVVAPHRPFRLPIVDLQAALRPDLLATEIAREEGARPFDLERETPFRAVLLRLDAQEHLLVLVIHHIAFDAWSVRVLFQEIAALYGAYIAGRLSPLEPLPAQYRDFVHEQRQRKREMGIQSHLSYWKSCLAGSPATLDLPYDRPEPAAPTFRGRQQFLDLDRGLTGEIKALSQKLGSTPYMTLLAAFQALLGRWSGQQDFNVGCPVTGRSRADMTPLIGFFVNNLVLRGDLSGDPRFEELLGRTREAVLGAFRHQDLPFETLVEELQPERQKSRTPLFQAAFQLLDASGWAPELEGLEVERVIVYNGTAKFDLALTLFEAEGGLTARFESAMDRFEAATIARLAGHLRILLQGIVARPERRLGELPLLDAPELQQVLFEWNDSAAECSCQRTVHELFAEQAARRPEAVAVVFQGTGLTYAALDRLSDGIARKLRGLGVRPEVPVGICVERSERMVAALLGILKAGGTYVPLDPSYPEERLALMIADSGIEVVVTEEPLLAALPPALFEGGSGTIHRVTIESMREVASAGSRERVASGVEGGHLAYVTYTSGSTGRPKGIAISHGAVIRLVLGTDYAQLRPGDRAAQVSSLSFDAATFEIWAPLLTGGSVVVLPREVSLSPQLLGRALRDEGVTALFLTTALFNEIAREIPEAFAVLRHLLFGGEAVDPRWVGEVLRRGAPERLLHVYGPTESTTYSTWFRVEAVQGRTVPIGRPLANTTIYVLDRALNPVPPGATGELCIGGHGLARGYWRQPALTAGRFIPHPFGSPGARLYRTGDLVRQRPDGAIEFLGRIDSQVKIRGFRIEPEEIEATLEQHPEVGEAVVLVREDGHAGGKRLVAYVSPASASAPRPDAGVLRAFLRSKLPDYMVPPFLMTLDRLPLNSNGKVDRGALPAPEAAGNEPDELFVAPRNEVEREVAEIWAALLGLERVGVHDDFFVKGGHSLLATQAVSRMSRQLDLEIPLSLLFENPTVSGFAVALVDRQARRLEDDRMAEILGMLKTLPEEEIERRLAEDLPFQGIGD